MSDIRANTISDAAGTGPIDLYKQSAAKAWADVDQRNTPHTVRNSFNSSSVTDGGLGKTSFNLTNAMSGNYQLSFGSVIISTFINSADSLGSTLSTSFQVQHYENSTGKDSIVNPAIHGDLA